MDAKEVCQKAIEFRHACKTFCKKKIISAEDIRFILEAGRMAPSSFGQEGWKFLVISNQKLKQKLRPLCWNQAQIETCSHLVVLLAAIEDLRPQSATVQKRFARRRLPKEQEEAYIKRYSEFLAKEIGDDTAMFAWSAKQTYLAAMQMMLAAASLEIDSCPIEGF
jgi:nitroreductase